ncbi:hypothetical protein ACHAW5_007884 [Stephanodiscus triporus]|uniref:Uncharacterized protein n=1 Tax=Stephanodiscus triporus TaxID=2934178 RepID=A0ABD3P8C2_9STRA
MTLPLDSHTGRVKNLLSCMICNASSTVVSGDTDSGFGVITVDTGVKSKGNSFATARIIMSLNPNIPTNRPFSTTNAALRASAILCPVSWIVVNGETMVDGLPAKTVRRASSAALLLFSLLCSSLDIASFKHFAISNTPTTVPLASVTGRWRNRFSTMVINASVAGSDMDTHEGLEVMTSATQVLEARRFFATTRRVTSVSVMIPASSPALLVIMAASPLLLASICAMESTVESEVDIMGAFGRSLDTGLLLVNDVARFFDTLLTLQAEMILVFVLSCNGVLNGVFTTAGGAA